MILTPLWEMIKSWMFFTNIHDDYFYIYQELTALKIACSNQLYVQCTPKLNQMQEDTNLAM